MTTKNSIKTVDLDSLGICEFCGTILNQDDLPSQDWHCPQPHCKGKLTNKSFGYRKLHGICKKAQWVGKGGKWTQRKPTEQFSLHGWIVKI